MYKEKSVTAVIVAAGISSRMGFDKLMHKIDGIEIVRRTLNSFDNHQFVDSIVVVASDNLTLIEKLFARYVPQKPLRIVLGGKTRTHSVKAGVLAASGDIVAIHDGARPFVSEKIITAVVEAAHMHGAAAPAVPLKDTIKMAEYGFVHTTPPRSTLFAVQTPQVFGRELFLHTLEAVPEKEFVNFTDDCMVVEHAGLAVKLTGGEYSNYKITTPEDLPEEKRGENMLRIGHGYDVHKFAKNRKLIIGGVEILHDKGLAGHSDADVLLHAISDALLGAAALGDIGKHFPDTSPDFKNADSWVLLCAVVEVMEKKGYCAQNIDATVICQAPKLASHISAMRARIAEALKIDIDMVSVKATTEEGLGFTGSKEGIAAHCVVLINGIVK